MNRLANNKPMLKKPYKNTVTRNRTDGRFDVSFLTHHEVHSDANSASARYG